MADFTAGNVLTAAQLDTAFNTFTINDETGTTYTLAASDAGEMVSIANNSGGTVTIPLNATVPFETGTHVHIVNAGTAGTYTIAIAGGGTLNGSSTTLTAGAAASVYKTATNTWRVLPFSGGDAAATVSGTTGSPTTTTVGTRTCYEFTGSGSFTVATAGKIRLLMVGGGAGGAAGGYGGGGAGGHIPGSDNLLGYLEAWFEAGTHTVTIGGGGAAGAAGSPSICGALTAIGGGPSTTTSGTSGGSGGGGYTTSGGAAAAGKQGNAGGSGNSTYAGGGGGAGAAGGNGSGAGGNGGVGLSSDITGSAVFRAGGAGGGSTGTGGNGGGAGPGLNLAGTANTGGGGTSGGAGGSGIIIILVG